MKDVLLCHSSVDKENFVLPLHDALLARGISVWLDDTGIGVGAPIQQRIGDALNNSRFLIACITPSFLTSAYARAELDAALNSQLSGRDISVMSLIWCVPDSDIAKLSPFLASRAYVRVSGDYGQQVPHAEIRRIAGQLKDLVSTSCRPLLLRRTEAQKYLGTIEQLYQEARDLVWLSGNDCDHSIQVAKPNLQSALRRGVSIRFILTDPESPAADMIHLIDPRFTSAQHFRNCVNESVQILSDCRDTFGGIEYRFLPLLPAMGFCIIDPHSMGGIVKVEIYAMDPFTPTDSRPHFLIAPETPVWREFFLQQWHNYWTVARLP